MIITIDGPVASGKSTVAFMVAQQLDYYYLNSGLLYRALAYIFLKNCTLNELKSQKISYTDIKLLFSHEHLLYKYTGNGEPAILFENQDITHSLKNLSVGQGASVIGTNLIVRHAITEYLQVLAVKRNVVADGRDCGTVVFPDAQYKIFLTASAQVRAYRWQKDQSKQGNIYTVEESLKSIQERDNRDASRPIAPLIPAKDALIIDSSHQTIQETVQFIVDLVNK